MPIININTSHFMCIHFLYLSIVYSLLVISTTNPTSTLQVMKERNVGGTALSNRISFYEQFGWVHASFTLHYNQVGMTHDIM